MVAGRRIVELPIPTYYGDEICHVNGMKYAGNVMKASLQAKFQKANLFYDRRFDCEPVNAGEKYPSKLEFELARTRGSSGLFHLARAFLTLDRASVRSASP